MKRVLFAIEARRELAQLVVSQLATMRRHPRCYERQVSAENVQTVVWVVMADEAEKGRG